MFTSMMPKVSVLIPVYNAEDFIAETISAVLAQTFQDFELILLDDNSSDNTQKVVASFNDDRIIYRRNEQNLGISENRNKLVEMARGEYVAVLDHDDICLPERLSVQVAFLDSHPEIAMVGSWFELKSLKKDPWWWRAVVDMGWVWKHPLTPQMKDLWHGNVMMHPTIMYRRKLFIENNIRYREEYTPAEDYDLIKQALLKSFKLYNIPQILVRYTLYGGNCSLLQREKMRQVDRKIKREVAALLHKKYLFFYPYFLVMLQKLRLKFLMRTKDV